MDEDVIDVRKSAQHGQQKQEETAETDEKAANAETDEAKQD